MKTFAPILASGLLSVLLLAACSNQAAQELEARAADQEQVIASLSSQLAEAESQAESLRTRLADAESQKASISEKAEDLEKTVERLSASPFRHGGLFYDSSQIALVKTRVSSDPWRSAMAALKVKADSYLGMDPQPITGSWAVPSPFDDPDSQDILVKPLEVSSNAMLALAQYYLFTGDEAYAADAARIARAWTGSLMQLDNQQAVYQAGWEMLVMAMAASMLEDYRGWNENDRTSFNSWINERTWHLISRDDSDNNHRYWLAAQSAAVGVLTDDPGLYRWAVAVYKRAISYDISSDGHMPRETARGELGMFYQNFALEPLAMVAEIARQQDEDLWDFTFENRDIKLAIDCLFSYFDRPEDWTWSQKTQDLTFLDPALGGKKIGWFELAYYQYRDPEIAEYLVEQRPVFARRSGGMTTLTHGLLLP